MKRFSLRTLLLLTTAVAILTGLLLRPALHQKRIYDRVQGLAAYQRGVPLTDFHTTGVRHHYWRLIERCFGLSYSTSYIELQINNPDVGDSELELLAGIQTLNHLRLTHTNVTDSFVQGVAQIPNIETLQLTNSKITDAALDILDDVSTLQYLSIAHTDISQARLDRFCQDNPDVRVQWSPWTSELQRLAIKNVVRDGFDVAFEEGIVRLVWRGQSTPFDPIVLLDLTGEHEVHLSVSSVDRIESRADMLADVKALTELVLVGGSCSDFSWLADIASLSSLRVNATHCPNRFQGIRSCGQLRRLALFQSTPFATVDFENLPDAPLEYLELRDLGTLTAAAQSGAAEAISRLQQLKELRLYGAQLDEQGWEAVAALPNLEFLDATYANVDDAIVKSLAKSLGKLRVLWLRQTQVTDEVVSELRKLKVLEDLDIGLTRITADGLEEVATIESLRTVTVEGIVDWGPRFTAFAKTRGL